MVKENSLFESDPHFHRFNVTEKFILNKVNLTWELILFEVIIGD